MTDMIPLSPPAASGKLRSAKSAVLKSAPSSFRPPQLQASRLQARLFRAEDLFADIHGIGETMEELALLLRRASCARESFCADLFGDLAALMTSLRWGAVAAAKAEAGGYVLRAQHALDAACGPPRAARD